LASTYLHTQGAEASGRRYVTLAPGEAVSWTVPIACDALVVRYSFPDAVAGGGQDGTLEVLTGTTVVPVPVTSRLTWEYGAPSWGATDVWNQPPSAGNPRHFWDEVSLVLPTLVSQGSTLSLRNPSGAVHPVLIDLIDFERLPPPVSPPLGSLSFADFAPAADGVTDDTAKLQAALNAAGSRVLYLPEGTYRIGPVALGVVTVQGAGLWRTRLVGPRSQLRFTGGTARVSDLAIFGETTTRNDLSDAENALAGNPGPGSLVERVWVEHKKCAFWVGGWNNPVGPTGLRITACRFRNLMADAVNLCSGTTQSVVDNTLVRGTGDDGLAAWSPQTGGPPGGANTFAHNLVQAPWVASGVSLYGGGPFRVVANTVEDTVTTGSGLFFASAFSSWPFTGTVEVTGNRLVRAGAHESDWGGPTGAIRILAAQAPLTGGNFVFQDNEVESPVASAVSIQGPWDTGALNFDGLTVDAAPLIADVRPQAKGRASFVRVKATTSGGWWNATPSTFTLTHP